MGKRNKIIIAFLIFLVIISCNKKPNIRNINFDKFYIKELGFKGFNIDSLDSVYPDKLIEVDSSDLAFKKILKNNTSAKYYYYSVLDTTNHYSYVYYFYNEGKEYCLSIINYSKKGELIDSHPLICNGGEDFYEIKSKFINDSIIEQVSIEGYYSYDPDSLIIDKSEKSIIKLKSTGEILVNPSN
ncbi:MAG: hypothetical protein GKR88_08645 [Flavobacteriaceae bacterium]|nr:MAG: hypothetical protein GKR88_08625 [Flavobacteriaceae bacterium]QMU64347.1 MAG: hypothetical protein GKR88_08645 [Flavobacteriaceae bacterium]